MNIGMGLGAGYSPRKGGGFTTEGLFGPSDSGFYYDFSKTDGLFVLSTGPTNVASDGDALGLVLDRRLWGGQTLAQIAAAATNKCTFDGSNPSTTTGLTKVQGGNNLGVISVEDDTANRVSAGLGSGNVVKLDNSAGDQTLFCNVAGTVGNLVPHQVAIYSRGSASVRYGLTAESGADVTIANTAGYTQKVMIFKPTLTSRVMFVAALAGQTVYFLLNTLKEIPGNHATSSGSTRPFWYDEGLGRGDAIDDTLLTTFTPAASGGTTMMARVTAPASLSGNQRIMGAFSSGNNGRIMVGFNSSGHLIGDAGSVTNATIVSAVDYRSQTGTAAISDDGTNWYLWWNGALLLSGARTGNMPTNALRLFSTASDTTAATFFGGDIYKAMAITRALTPSEILRTHNLWSN